MDVAYGVACTLAGQVLRGQVPKDLAMSTLGSRMQKLSQRNQLRLKKAFEYILDNAVIRGVDTPTCKYIPEITLKNERVARGFSRLTICSHQARVLILQKF